MYVIVEAKPDSAEGYQPFGAAADLFRLRVPEVMLSGPAGTGKTRAALEKMDLAAWKYAGMRAAFVRKTRRSMTNTVMVTYGTKVLLPNTPVRFRTSEQDYVYPNGSVITLAGMDKASKILSSEYDIIYVNQAEELSEDDFETLTTRLRNGVMPYQQIIGDANPGPPSHWLRRRMDEGRTRELVSRHEDNPLLFDQVTRTWTKEGERYVLGILENLTGVRYWRLRHGRWVSAEGAVYGQFDRGVHLVYADEIANRGIRYYLAGVDWGFTNPGVIQVWGVDGDGRLYRVREIYHTGKLIDWWVERGKALHEAFGIRQFVCDPSGAAYIAAFQKAGLPAIGGYNNISHGIQAVAKRLESAEDGLPRLFLAYDAIWMRDETLVLAEKAWCTEMEFDLYVWPQGRQGRAASEVPVDEHNHGLDAMRYVVAYVDELTGPVEEGWARGMG